MDIPSKISNFEFDEGRFVKCSLDICHDGWNYNNSYFANLYKLNVAFDKVTCFPVFLSTFIIFI